jgi:hypothetical protein
VYLASAVSGLSNMKKSLKEPNKILENEIAIYYPYIDIPDASLIKTAALYWDKLQTIVPSSLHEISLTVYKTKASREAKKEGFLEERIVNSLDVSVRQTGQNLIWDIRNIPEIKEHFKNTFQSAEWRHIGVDKYSIIYKEKFDPIHLLEIMKELEKTGLQFTPLRNGGMIVPKLFTNLYMSRLASTIAQNENSVPLTNEYLWQSAALDGIVDYSEERKQNQAKLVKLSLQTISIHPDVPLAEILKFRDKHRKELINYRKYIRKLVRQISKGLTDSEKQSLFEEMIKDEFLPAKKEIEAKLSENADWFVIKSIVIMLAGIGAVLSTDGRAWLANLLHNAVTGGINCLGYIRNDRKCIKGHSLGYLYEVQKKLGTR